MKTLRVCACICASFLAFCAAGPQAGEQKLTIIHTNDLHSHLLGFSPIIDFTPEILRDDETSGGWARIATVIKATRASRLNPVLVLDAGDFLMGSLFHLRSREEAFELRLLREMGYDALALGNHEFDLKPSGLARILAAAANEGGTAPLLLANAVFDPRRAEDDTLEAAFRSSVVRPYIVLTRGGMRIGLFGLMGKDAAEVAPFADPVTFEDPLVAADRVVRKLRDEERVDLVVCLSHCGLWDDKSKSEDEMLARKVPGIDIIVGGHTHTKTDAPIMINGTPIVQSGEHGKQLGILDLVIRDGQVSVERYQSVPIDDSAESDPAVSAMIARFKHSIDENVLKEHGLSFDEAVAQTEFDLSMAEDECSLGNLVTDSIRWYVNAHARDASDRVAAAIESFGMIRDPLLKGRSGRIAVCDLFAAFPLGIGLDDSMGHPLLTCYLTAREVKKALEVLTSVYPSKGSDYFLQVSGLRFKYNPRRMIFDRVTDIWLEDEEGNHQPLDCSPSNRALYGIASNFYNSAFLKVIGDYTWNILKIVPKDKNGRPIQDLSAAVVDLDPAKPGIQEMKEWVGVLEYVRSFADTDGDGLPEIPARYREKEGRIVAAPSWSPVSLLRRGSALTWAAFGVVVLLAALLAFIVCRVVRWLRRRRVSA